MNLWPILTGYIVRGFLDLVHLPVLRAVHRRLELRTRSEVVTELRQWRLFRFNRVRRRCVEIVGVWHLVCDEVIPAVRLFRIDGVWIRFAVGV
jgi:hypothetical protein